MAAPLSLPPNWASFVDLVTLGSSPADAAKALGYADHKTVAAALLRLPQVRKALAVAIEVRLQSSAAPLALSLVEEILQDPTAPKAVRAKLAIAVLDRVRDVPDTKQAVHQQGKALQDLSLRELEALVVQLREADPRPGQMLDITPEPVAKAKATP